MDIQLDSIKFNHAPNGHETDALTLGRNGNTFVRVPEWRSSGGHVQSAVAYAVRGTDADALTIQARFRVPTPQITEVEVRALDANNPAANLLGEVGRAAVSFNFDTLSPFVTFRLNNTRLAGAGVGAHEVRWRWQVRVPPSQNFTDLAFTSHKIYTVLAQPNAPWQQPPNLTDEFQLPWVEVLDWACRWAGGARDEDQAAELITRNLHALGPHVIRYDQHGGDSTYTHSPSLFTNTKEFLCNRFLRLLRGEGLPPHRLVNCSDCATIVSVFANVLGCSLSPARMSAQPPDGVGFLLNLILPVGFDQWSPNFTFGRFSYHEVAWKGACTEADGLFDACLRVDRDADPFGAPHEPLLAVNMPFGFQGDRQYGDLLARSVTGGRDRCIPARSPIPVRIGNPLLPEPPLPPGPQFAALMDRFDFDLQRDLELPPENILIWNFHLLDEQLPDWQLVETSDLLNAVGRVRSLETIWRRPDDDESYLCIDVYDCTSPEEARRAVFGLLGQTSHPDVRRREGIGEVAFALPSGILVLFARANLAVRVRDASDQPRSVEQIAEHLDRLLTEKPGGAEGFSELEAAVVAPAVTAARPGEAVPLVSDALVAGRGRSWYKFFSPSGVFRVIDGRPHYVIADGGEQEVSILEVDPERKTTAGKMRFSL